MCRLSWNLGTSTSWNPQGLSTPVMGLLYLFLSSSPQRLFSTQHFLRQISLTEDFCSWRNSCWSVLVSPDFCFQRPSSLSDLSITNGVWGHRYLGVRSATRGSCCNIYQGRHTDVWFGIRLCREANSLSDVYIGEFSQWFLPHYYVTTVI